MAHEVPPLPYDYKALEPHIDEQTMHLHHDKHHQAYVTNLNGAIEKHPDLGKHSAEDLLRNLNSVPEDVRTTVRNNGGGHVNHSMFWAIMKPNGGGEPTGAIGEQIKKDFGSFEDFKKQFNETTAKQFGSGWGWLIWDGKLKIITTANQDSPLSQGLLSDPRQRRVGARLLPEVPEPAAGISRGVVEHGQLGRDQQALRAGEEVGPVFESGGCNAAGNCVQMPFLLLPAEERAFVSAAELYDGRFPRFAYPDPYSLVEDFPDVPFALCVSVTAGSLRSACPRDSDRRVAGGGWPGAAVHRARTSAMGWHVGHFGL